MGCIIEFKARENLIEVYVKRDVNEKMKTVHELMRNFGDDTTLVPALV